LNTDQIHAVTQELRATLTGRFFGKIFQLTPLSFAFDFGLRGDFLYVSVEPASPRLYLIHRRLRDLEKQSVPHGPFAQLMRSTLSGASLTQISKDPLDRIVRFTFHNDGVFRRLVVQLTGRTADLFLLDELNRITAVLREQGKTRLGDVYLPPPRPLKEPSEAFTLGVGPPSAQLDA
jgi:predicted ribosome quality control (RQC) complex YloA/Tae2 family protein